MNNKTYYSVIIINLKTNSNISFDKACYRTLEEAKADLYKIVSIGKPQANYHYQLLEITLNDTREEINSKEHINIYSNEHPDSVLNGLYLQQI